MARLRVRCLEVGHLLLGCRLGLRLLAFQRTVVPLPDLIERKLLLGCRAGVQTSRRRLLVEVALVAFVLDGKVVGLRLISRRDLRGSLLVAAALLVVCVLKLAQLRLLLSIIHLVDGLLLCRAVIRGDSHILLLLCRLLFDDSVHDAVLLT